MLQNHLQKLTQWTTDTGLLGLSCGTVLVVEEFSLVGCEVGPPGLGLFQHTETQSAGLVVRSMQWANVNAPLTFSFNIFSRHIVLIEEVA